MRYFHFLIAIVFLLLAANLAVAEAPLRIATEGAYPPFNDVNDKGEPVGFDVDIAQALCEAIGRECTITTVAWESILDELAKGNVDLIVASMAKTKEREKLALFTNYYYRSRTMFVADPSIPFKQTREGVKGLTLATQANTVQEEYLIREFLGAANIKSTESIGETFTLLADGQVDAILSDTLSVYEFLKSDSGSKFDFVGTPLPADNPSSIAYIAVSKDLPELVNQLNDALREIKLNGVYDKINRRYFPFSIY